MKKAFTMIELLVAMGIASLVFLLVSTLLITMINSNSKSKNQEAFEQTKIDVGMEITNAVRWGKSVSVANNQIVVDGRTYSMDGGRVYKNENPISPQDVVVSNWRVKDLSTKTGLVSLVLTADLSRMDDIFSKDTLRIVVSQRQLEVQDGK